MLEKPDIPDEIIAARLEADYGLSIVEVTFLPLGGDLSTAVYRAVSQDETPYFCKLKRGVFDPASVALPRYLSEQGIAQVIPPLVTTSGGLWATLNEFNLLLYPFVEGTNGYDVELTERQWADFGRAIKRLHTIRIPATLLAHIQEEHYSAAWRMRCRSVIARLDNDIVADPLTAEMVAFLRSKREMTQHAIRRAEQLAQVMSSRSLDFVVCHSDIHPGNLFIDAEGTLFIVDWDYPLLAPKERDLMFIGGGQGFKPYIAEQELKLFYQGYGRSEIDPIALAYYRYERGITDITVECERILSHTLGAQDRAQSLEILQLYFLPGCTLEMAHASDRTENIG